MNDVSGDAVLVTVTGGVTTVVITGELDIAGADALGDALARVVESGPSAVAVDLSAVTFIDAAGLRPLVAGCQQAERAGIRFVLVEPAANVRRVLEITRLDGLVGQP